MVKLIEKVGDVSRVIEFDTVAELVEYEKLTGEAVEVEKVTIGQDPVKNIKKVIDGSYIEVGHPNIEDLYIEIANKALGTGKSVESGGMAFYKLIYCSGGKLVGVDCDSKLPPLLKKVSFGELMLMREALKC